MAADNLTLEQRVDRFLATHGGDAKKAVAALLTDNLKYRKRLRDAREGDGPYKPDEQLQRENEDLQRENERLTGLVPAAGAVVLTGEDAATWPKFKALNLAPDKLTEAVKQRDEALAKLAERDRGDVLAKVAEELGFRPTVFAKVVAAERLHVEMKDVQEKGDDGKTVTKSVPHVRPSADEKAALVPLAEFAEKELVDYLPALKADGTNTRTETAATGGTEYPEQRRGGNTTASPSREKQLEAARATGEYQL